MWDWNYNYYGRIYDQSWWEERDTYIYIYGNSLRSVIAKGVGEQDTLFIYIKYIFGRWGGKGKQAIDSGLSFL